MLEYLTNMHEILGSIHSTTRKGKGKEGKKEGNEGGKEGEK